jgi:hypothetical protein
MNTAKKFEFLPVFLEKVPTTDQFAPKDGKIRYDVLAWSDKEKTIPKASWGWFNSRKPTRRNKFVTLNCYRWEIVWLN